MKVCIVCGIEKVLDDYYTNNNNPDGKHNVCRACEKIRQARIRSLKDKKPRKVWESCIKCGEKFDEIVKHGSKGRCRKCYNTEFYATNKDLIKDKYIQTKKYLKAQNYDKLRRDNKESLKQFIVNIERRNYEIDSIDAYKMLNFFEIYYDGSSSKYDHLSVEDQLIIFWEYLSKIK